VLDDRTRPIPNLSMLGGWAVCTTSACQSESGDGAYVDSLLAPWPLLLTNGGVDGGAH
jgi:hypothetical protein